MTVRDRALTWVGSGMVLAAIAWLGPLMFDQLTFFGDREQEADAAAALSAMPWPALLLAAGAVLISVGGRLLNGVIAAVPLVAVALAWTAPDALYQLLAYGFSAPIAVGSVLAAIVPFAAGTPRPLVVVLLVVAAAAAILAAPALAGVVVLAVLWWWGLSRRARGAAGASALD